VSILIAIVLMLAMIYLPPFDRWFDHVPLPPIYLAALMLYAPAVYGLDWLRKLILRRAQRTRGRKRQGVTAL
jgi:hypothetical protein